MDATPPARRIPTSLKIEPLDVVRRSFPQTTIINKKNEPLITATTTKIACNEPEGPPPSIAKVTVKVEPSGPPPFSQMKEENNDGVTSFNVENLQNRVNNNKRCQRDFDFETLIDANDLEEQEEEQEYRFEPAQFVSMEETDSRRLEQRQRQIDLGKNTIGYQNYIENVPRIARQKFNKIHPITPNMKESVSKRSFDGKIKAWRRSLHFWDVLPGQSTAQRVALPPRVVKKARLISNDVDMKEEKEVATDVDSANKSIFDQFEA